MKMTKKVVLVAVFILAVMGLGGCGKTKADLKDYISIKVSGTDGYGQLELDVDYDRLGKALEVDEQMEDLKDAKDFSDVADALNKGDALYKLKCDASKTEKLKNGDEVQITARGYEKVEEELGASFSNTEFTYTVSGLDPVKEIDPFEGVSISFEGTLPNYYVEINKPEQYKNLITYQADVPDIIAAGGTVTVNCHYDEKQLGKAGYAIRKGAQDSKEFTIEGIDTYVDSFEKIGEDTLAEMKEKCQKMIKKKYFGANGSYDDIQYMLTDRKDIDYNWEEPKGKLKSGIKYEKGYFKVSEGGNSVGLLFSFKVKDRKTSARVYAVVVFEDVTRKASGDIYVSYEESGYYNFAVSYLDVSVKDIENEVVTNNGYTKAE